MGRRVDPRSPAQAIAAGIGYLSEDRKETGLFLEMSIADNILAVDRRHGTTGDMTAGRGRPRPWRSAAVYASSAEARTSRSDVSAAGTSRKWPWPSGCASPVVLIVDEPTRGVDVGAKAEIHQLLFQLAAKGTSVVVISSDMPEVLAVADRILVMREGRLVGELGHDQATEDKVMELAAMSGAGGTE